MPTYEYRCKDCGHELEAVQSFTDDALTECPSCSGTLKKKFGNVGISFKGSGFYKTDSRSSSSKTKSSSTSDSGSSSSSDGGTSETKGTSASDSSSSSSSASKDSSSSGGSKEKAAT